MEINEFRMARQVFSGASYCPKPALAILDRDRPPKSDFIQLNQLANMSTLALSRTVTFRLKT
jgi:hypothetical protein